MRTDRPYQSILADASIDKVHVHVSRLKRTVNTLKGSVEDVPTECRVISALLENIPGILKHSRYT